MSTSSVFFTVKFWTTEGQTNSKKLDHVFFTKKEVKFSRASFSDNKDLNVKILVWNLQEARSKLLVDFRPVVAGLQAFTLTFKRQTQANPSDAGLSGIP